mmetsp:Transcript_67941/g.171315  ORF Transcript_67941/g.171315 Transcript_67941/m.171315 type:complete len:206 (+) Transcript_67941:256-873(+)
MVSSSVPGSFHWILLGSFNPSGGSPGNIEGAKYTASLPKTAILTKPLGNNKLSIAMEVLRLTSTTIARMSQASNGKSLKISTSAPSASTDRTSTIGLPAVQLCASSLSKICGNAEINKSWRGAHSASKKVLAKPTDWFISYGSLGSSVASSVIEASSPPLAKRSVVEFAQAQDGTTWQLRRACKIGDDLGFGSMQRPLQPRHESK